MLLKRASERRGVVPILCMLHYCTSEGDAEEFLVVDVDGKLHRLSVVAVGSEARDSVGSGLLSGRATTSAGDSFGNGHRRRIQCVRLETRCVLTSP